MSLILNKNPQFHLHCLHPVTQMSLMSRVTFVQNHSQLSIIANLTFIKIDVTIDNTFILLFCLSKLMIHSYCYLSISGLLHLLWVLTFMESQSSGGHHIDFPLVLSASFYAFNISV